MLQDTRRFRMTSARMTTFAMVAGFVLLGGCPSPSSVTHNNTPPAENNSNVALAPVDVSPDESVLGLFADNQIRSLSAADHQIAQDTTLRVLELSPTGASTPWRNEYSGHSGTITPQRTYQNQGQVCRDFSLTINLQGEQYETQGTACRHSDGSWSVIDTA